MSGVANGNDVFHMLDVPSSPPTDAASNVGEECQSNVIYLSRAAVMNR